MVAVMTADRGENLTSNERSALALIATFGGLNGLASMPKGTFLEVSRILRADPDDDLSGLRILADRMQFGVDFILPVGLREDEPIIDGDIARHFLLTTGRAYTTKDGNLVPKPKLDHLGYAALSISIHDQPESYTDMYELVTEGRIPLSLDMVRDIGNGMIESFYASNQPETE